MGWIISLMPRTRGCRCVLFNPDTKLYEGCDEPPQGDLSFCWHSLVVSIETPTERERVVQQNDRTLADGCSCRRRDCHSAAPPSAFSRCFNRKGEGDVSKMTELLRRCNPEEMLAARFQVISTEMAVRTNMDCPQHEWPESPRIAFNGPNHLGLRAWPQSPRIALNGPNHLGLPAMARITSDCVEWPESPRWLSFCMWQELHFRDERQWHACMHVHSARHIVVCL